MQMVEPRDRRVAAIACFLAQHGASLHYLNHKGATPMEYASNCGLESLIVGYQHRREALVLFSASQFWFRGVSSVLFVCLAGWIDTVCGRVLRPAP